GINLDADDFRRYVEERCASEPGEPIALGDLHASDLYLACACSRGRPEALSAFDQHFSPRIADYVARMNSAPAFADEVRQHLRKNLFVADGAALPQITGYRGRGSLGAWLRVAAVRIARSLLRRQKITVGRSLINVEHVPLGERGLELRSTVPDPE